MVVAALAPAVYLVAGGDAADHLPAGPRHARGEAARPVAGGIGRRSPGADPSLFAAIAAGVRAAGHRGATTATGASRSPIFWSNVGPARVRISVALPAA